MIAAPLTLPRVAPDVPTRYTIGDDADFMRRLSLALLRGRQLSEADAAPLNDSSTETDLALNAMPRIWKEITSDIGSFDWSLAISDANNMPDTALVRITTAEGAGSGPIRFIGSGIRRLESIQPGLGQTVLAVLYEACHHYLPSVCTPPEAMGLAEYMYWYSNKDEVAALPELRDMNTAPGDPWLPDQEFLDHIDVPRRAEFFASAPPWVITPKRVLDASEARRYYDTNLIAWAVIDACDAIHRTITTGGPFARVDLKDTSEYVQDYSLILAWDRGDSLERILDDFWQGEMQCGDPESCAALHISTNGRALGTWLDRMRNTATLAKAVSNLVMLISTPDGSDIDGEPVKVQVRV
ncbi:PRTRC system protein F [Burkholderia vietnamiensis]|uniref:PRTRC system protein F n=1 Tax=Burkholderia vietnamiensis TaxID=60552 RepID=UPI001CF28675|nr:PRTRC system protein F [Burkholderia vietnamiensis]MCA8013862.1 PRTRC system protein F [Burkholderia vietnamiensis]